MFSLVWLFILKISNLQKKNPHLNFLVFFKLFCHICPLLLLPCPPPLLFFILVEMLTVGRYPESTSLPASRASLQMWTFCMTRVPSSHQWTTWFPRIKSTCIQISPMIHPCVLPHSPTHSKLIQGILLKFPPSDTSWTSLIILML